MKAVWQGSIAFGLVNIPIKLYSVAEPKEISFRMLCGKCHSPLKYKRYCPICKHEVEWVNIVKGLEIKKGKFYILTQEKLTKLKPEKTDLIEVLAFIDFTSIDPIYFNKSYYVAPAKAKEKAFWLFQEVLAATAKAALAKFVMRNKEHVSLIRPYKGGLVLTTLHYTYELRSIASLEALQEKVKVGKEELQLANELIKKLTKKEINLASFKDSFAEKLKELILGKVKVVKEKKPKPTKLLEALKLSVKEK